MSISNAFNRLSLQSSESIKGKKALVRVDFNVPLSDDAVIDDSRIKAALPTIELLNKSGCAIVILSHLGRPKGKVVEKMRLDLVAKRLEELINIPVQKIDTCIGETAQTAKEKLNPGEILLLENTRFHLEETENLTHFSRQLAQGMDMFVQDAFGCVHRSHASTEGVTHFLPSMMGLLVEKEFEALKTVFTERKKPITLVISGAKIDTKIGVIRNFLPIADNILIGGGIANTFFHAKGYNVQDSLVELDKVELARNILQEAGEESCRIVLPRDLVVAKELSEDAQTRIIHRKNGEILEKGDKILDIGPESITMMENIIATSQTIVWNGPMGVFEFAPFAAGTKAIGEAIANNKNISLVGGGDSVDAIHRFGFDESNFSHISTGGGAMLEFLEGKMLPGISALRTNKTL